MGKYEKLFDKILRGTSDHNLDFTDFCTLLKRLGFQERIKGSHHIFYRENITEVINIQPNNSKAKAYQVKQIRNLIIKYKLGENDVN